MAAIDTLVPSVHMIAPQWADKAARRPSALAIPSDRSSAALLPTSWSRRCRQERFPVKPGVGGRVTAWAQPVDWIPGIEDPGAKGKQPDTGGMDGIPANTPTSRSGIRRHHQPARRSGRMPSPFAIILGAAIADRKSFLLGRLVQSLTVFRSRTCGAESRLCGVENRPRAFN